MRWPTSALLGALLTACVVTVGCRAHVVLDEPPLATAPLEERALAYEALRPQVLRDPVLAPGGSMLPRVLVLNDGTVVDDPRDLAPLVKENAATTRYADEARALGDLATWLYVGAAASGVIALAGEVGGGMYAIANAEPGGALGPQAELGLGVMVGSVAVGALGAAATLIPAVFVAQEADRLRDIAFQSYDRDLRARLALVPKPEVLTAQWQDAR